jgi:hypothetical protein
MRGWAGSRRRRRIEFFNNTRFQIFHARLQKLCSGRDAILKFADKRRLAFIANWQCFSH